MSNYRNANILRMSEEKTVKLIYLYRSEECLWKIDSINFSNKQERIRAYQRIAEALQLPDFEPIHVRMKLKNLRNGYCQELKKIASKGGDYKPTLVWFPLMDSFLRHYLSKTTIGELVEQITEEQERIEKASMPNEAVIKEEWYIIEGSDPEAEDVLIQSYDNVEPVAVPLAQIEGTREVSENAAAAEEPTDYFDDFGKYIASLLRTLPVNQAMALQPKIINMITNYALLDED